MQPEGPPTLQDKVFYPGRAWEYSHPDRLATNAWLFGMDPAPVAECRVLELGCGAGQNLIPMAYVLHHQGTNTTHPAHENENVETF